MPRSLCFCASGDGCNGTLSDCRMNRKDYVWLVNPRLIAVTTPIQLHPIPLLWHLQSSLLSWCTASRNPAGLRRARCTWWSSRKSWRCPGWRWPAADTSCPGPPAAMAVCPWVMVTNHCCLQGRQNRETSDWQGWKLRDDLQIAH